MRNKITIGLIHGRFQPFHLQHMEYFFEAKKRCDYLYVGLTRCWPASLLGECVESPHRSEQAANLLSYYERQEMIANCLDSQGVSRGEYGFLPFPIDNPECLSYFVRSEVMCFTTVCDDWNLHKIDVLKRLGYNVDIVIDRREAESRISGSEIRRDILAGGDRWRELVDNSVADYLEGISYFERLLVAEAMA